MAGGGGVEVRDEAHCEAGQMPLYVWGRQGGEHRERICIMSCAVRGFKYMPRKLNLN